MFAVRFRREIPDIEGENEFDLEKQEVTVNEK